MELLDNCGELFKTMQKVATIVPGITNDLIADVINMCDNNESVPEYLAEVRDAYVQVLASNLKEERNARIKLQREMRNQYQAGQTIYVLQVPNAYRNDRQFIFKLGKTKDLVQRQRTYNTNMSGGAVMIYHKYCIDANVVEKVLFHVLRQYKMQENREFFDCEFEIIRQTIDRVVVMLDEFKHTETVIKSKYF